MANRCPLWEDCFIIYQACFNLSYTWYTAGEICIIPEILIYRVHIIYILGFHKRIVWFQNLIKNISVYIYSTYNVNTNICPSFWCICVNKLPMLTTGSKSGENFLLCFEILKSVITLQHKFCGCFNKNLHNINS